MSTLTEIEAAVNTLSRRDQRKLYESLARRLERPAKKKAKPSLYDLSKDLCGIVNSGIGDLASNPKHMEGYGRSRR